MLVAVWQQLRDAGLDTELLDLADDLHALASAAAPLDMPQPCAEPWAAYVVARRNGMTRAEARAGVTALLRAFR